MRLGINTLVLLGASLLLITGCAERDGQEVKIDLPEEELGAFIDEKDSPQEESESLSALERGQWKEFAVYIDSGYFKNHFIPSGWMGDHGDIKFNPNWKEGVHSRRSCIKVTYTAEARQGNSWAGMYWQNPENNWGMRKGVGFDLRSAKALTFWARGEQGGEIVREFKMGGISGAYPDTDTASVGPIALTSEWKEYTIDLSDMDLSYIIGGFCWVASALDNPEGMTFYLDDIVYK